jgi:hypothetical protein
VEEILARCIEDIKAGRAGLEECLGRYPSMRGELEPLLRVAMDVRQPADVRPSDAFKVRARVNLIEHIHAGQAGKRAPGPVPGGRVAQGWFTGWARAAAVAIAVILLITAGGTGTAYASQSSLPGDTLYPVKLGTEELQRVVTFDDAAEVELELKFAAVRLDELNEIVTTPEDQATRGGIGCAGIFPMAIIGVGLSGPGESYAARPDRIAEAIAGYQRNLSLAIAKAEQVPDGEASLERVALAILGHLQRLDAIEDAAPESDRQAIVNSKGIAIDGHITAVQNLAKVDPVRAAEINLQAIQGRLDRATAEAAKGNGQGVESALQQYEELRRFSGRISAAARTAGRDTKAIDELNARATTGQLESLGKIYGNAPQETKNSVEQAMGVTVEQHGQAVQGLQQQGAQGDIPTEPPLPGGIPDDVKKNIQGPGSGGGSGGGRR